MILPIIIGRYVRISKYHEHSVWSTIRSRGIFRRICDVTIGVYQLRNESIKAESLSFLSSDYSEININCQYSTKYGPINIINLGMFYFSNSNFRACIGALIWQLHVCRYYLSIRFTEILAEIPSLGKYSKTLYWQVIIGFFWMV